MDMDDLVPLPQDLDFGELDHGITSNGQCTSSAAQDRQKTQVRQDTRDVTRGEALLQQAKANDRNEQQTDASKPAQAMVPESTSMPLALNDVVEQDADVDMPSDQREEPAESQSRESTLAHQNDELKRQALLLPCPMRPSPICPPSCPSPRLGRLTSPTARAATAAQHRPALPSLPLMLLGG